MHDFVVHRAIDDQGTHQPALEPRQCVVDDGVAPRPIDLEVDDRGAAGRHGDCWDARQRLNAEARAFVHVVEDLADDVERGGEVRAANSEKEHGARPVRESKSCTGKATAGPILANWMMATL